MKKNILIIIAAFALFFLFIPLVKADYTLEVDYPTVGGQQPSADLVQYIRYLYLFALSAVGVAAFGALVYGGFQYLLSAGSVGSAEEAKKWMWGAIYGLVLALAAVLILRTINPDLINLKGPSLPTIQPPAAQPQTSAADWSLRSDCTYMPAGTACYDDSFCAAPKPSNGDYCCCK